MYPYPISYFASLFPIKESFYWRKILNWIQIVFTSIFLISLNLAPIAIQTASRPSQNLDTFIDGVYHPLTEEAVQDLYAHMELSEGKLSYSGEQADRQSDQGRLLLGHQDQVQVGQELTLYFDQDSLKIYKKEKLLADISYQGMQKDDFVNKGSLKEVLNRNWYQQNRMVISLGLVMGAGLMLTFNFLLLIVGASFFLYLTRKSRLFSFRTAKECVNFVLNCLGLPSILACLVGLIGQPLPNMLLVQNILFVLILVLIFYQTHYRDKKE